MPTRARCEALDRLKSEAASAVCEAKETRRSRDVSIYEDAELSREVQHRIHELIKHLLVGHKGQPCPAGDRPIVSAETPSENAEISRPLIPEPAHAGKG
jgi:hypothetical protein